MTPAHAAGGNDERMVRLSGIAAAPGRAAGPAWILDASIAVQARAIADEDVRSELLRLEHALAAAEDRIPHSTSSAEEGELAWSNGTREDQRGLVSDAAFADACRRRIREDRVSAETAVRRVLDDADTLLGGEEEPAPLWKDDDLEHAGDRVLRALLGSSGRAPSLAPPPGAVVIARSVSVADAAHLARASVAGIVTETGGEGSALARVSRALGLPHVAGVRLICQRVRPGATIVVDGSAGEVLLDPDDRSVQQVGES